MKEARKEAYDRQAMAAALKEKLQKNPKALIGDKGYRKYLKLNQDHLCLDQERTDEERRFYGKWVLQANTPFLRKR